MAEKGVEEQGLAMERLRSYRGGSYFNNKYSCNWSSYNGCRSNYHRALADTTVLILK